MIQLYLTRRNLLTLLSKLDRAKGGEETKRTIIKKDTKHKDFPNSHPNIFVTAVEDESYYKDREPGFVFPEDAPMWRQKDGL